MDSIRVYRRCVAVELTLFPSTRPSTMPRSGADTAAHVRDTWFYPGYDTCFEGRKYNTCPDNVKVRARVRVECRCVEPTTRMVPTCAGWLTAFLVAGNLATVQGVDPGVDPVLNHMNYVYTQCQYQKGHFTDGQMITMVSKFGTFTPDCLVSRICAL
jgi:hypothetical protein